MTGLGYFLLGAGVAATVDAAVRWPGRGSSERAARSLLASVLLGLAAAVLLAAP